ncbi:MAG: tetratricopeptide repeat protein [Erythrobacter sp.]
MDSNKHSRMTGPKMALIVSTALASVALAGCTTSAAPRAETSFNKAQVALGKGQVDRAVSHAEAAVLAEPRNAGFRALLGAAYLESGRFQAAATSFDDALQLGDTDPRTVLSYALAQTALGANADAIQKLNDWSVDIDPADLGLAYALAGEPERGVHVLINALRGGQNTAKVRQNLAYSYALAGNWRAARVMAAEDVPAGQLNDRLAEWAAQSKPEDYQTRVAGLLQVDGVSDIAQPQHLALGNFDSHATLVAEAGAQAPIPVAETGDSEALAFSVPSSDPAPVESFDPTPAPVSVAANNPAPARTARREFVSNPVVQAVPANYRETERRSAPVSARIAARSSQRRMAPAATGSADTHMVQLGSFSTNADAERAWEIFQNRYPQLSNHDVVITEAVVRGKTYHRVAVAGFGLGSARAMCSSVRSSGRGCFAYAKVSPPAGAIDRGVRIAARTR